MGSLNASKSVGGNIPVRLLKLAEAQCAPILTSLFNDALETGIFPSELNPLGAGIIFGFSTFSSSR